MTRRGTSRIIGVFVAVIVVAFSVPAFCEEEIEPFAWKEGLEEEVSRDLARVEEHPDDPEAHADLAMSYAYTGKLQEGWAELVKVNELNPEYPSQAAEKYAAIVAKEPHNWRARFRLAFALYFLERKEEAKKQFEAILEDHPDHIWALNYMAYIWADLGDVPKAIELWQESIELAPNIAATHFVLGHAYLRIGNYFKSMEELALAWRLDNLGF